jgi:hypothetical protein
MSYLFSEASSLGGTAGQFSGKNKGVLITNNSGASTNVDCYTYTPQGVTQATRVGLFTGQSVLLPIRIWGISCGAGITAQVLS